MGAARRQPTPGGPTSKREAGGGDPNKIAEIPPYFWWKWTEHKGVSKSISLILAGFGPPALPVSFSLLARTLWKAADARLTQGGREGGPARAPWGGKRGPYPRSRRLSLLGCGRWRCVTTTEEEKRETGPFGASEQPTVHRPSSPLTAGEEGRRIDHLGTGFTVDIPSFPFCTAKWFICLHIMSLSFNIARPF